MAKQGHFYVTVFSNASRDIYEQNTHGDITVKLAVHVHLVSTSKWEVELCENLCSSSPPIEESLHLIYPNLISPQFLGDSTVRRMRTFVFPSCQHEIRNVYYVPVEQRRFQDIRIECLTTEGLHIPIEDITTPTKWCFIFGKITSGRKVYKTGRRHLE